MSLLPIRQIEFTPSAEKDLRKLPADVRKRILDKIDLYISSGHVMAFAKSLVNLPPATHRFRIGKYRVCFFLEGSKLVIDGIDTREDVYRRR